MKIGDKVIMNDHYMVSNKNKGKVFKVKSEPFDLCGTESVLLEGNSGGYAIDGLTVIDCYKYGSYPCFICDGYYCGMILNH